jgi:Flp pilus assembly protein TadD
MGIGLPLLLAVAAAGAAPGDEWIELKTEHFTVASNAPEARAREIALQFERARRLMRDVGGLEAEPDRPITVLAVKDRAGMAMVAPTVFEGQGASGAAGLFTSGLDRSFILAEADLGGFLPELVSHEYVHALTVASFRRCPLWLLEGLAQFHAAGDAAGGELRWGRLDEKSREQLRKGPWIPLKDLLFAQGDSPYYNDRRWVWSFYAQSAALTHYLLGGPEPARRSFAELKQQLRAGADGQAVAMALGDLEVLERELRAYLRGPAFLSHSWKDTGGPALDMVSRPLPPAEALALQAHVLLVTGRPVEARRLAERARFADPGNPRAWWALGAAQAIMEWRRAARESAASGLALAPDDPLLNLLAAGIPFRRDDEAAGARAEGHLRRAAASATVPVQVEALSRLARRLAERAEGREEAVALARQACAADPESFDARLALALALRRSGLAEAEAAEEQVRALARADTELLPEAARFLHVQGRDPEAEALLREARTLRPRDLATLRALAFWLFDRGCPEESEAVHREALALQPESPGLQNDLAYLLARQGTRLEEALRMIELALQRRPSSAAFLDTRGWILFRLGRLPAAERDLRVALEASHDATILDHLANVVAARGRKAEAAEAWRLALEHTDDDELKSAIERELTEAEATPRS